jgi:hypothetical protein
MKSPKCANYEIIQQLKTIFTFISCHNNNKNLKKFYGIFFSFLTTTNMFLADSLNSHGTIEQGFVII